MGGSRRKGSERRWGRFRSRRTSTGGAWDAEQLDERSRVDQATPIADVRLAEPVTVAGVVRTVTVRPRAGSPAVEVDIADGSGDLVLIWLGRRTIRGITPGRRLVADGRVTEHHRRRVMFNPGYELLPAGE